jgi:hypothetical protein
MKYLLPLLLLTLPLQADIILEWEDGSEVETGFKIQRAEGSGEFTDLTTVPANTTTYRDKTAKELTTYSYRVASFQGITDVSEWSEAPSIRHPINPPRNPKAGTVVSLFLPRGGKAEITASK